MFIVPDSENKSYYARLHFVVVPAQLFILESIEMHMSYSQNDHWGVV